jgi:hypothetical protein
MVDRRLVEFIRNQESKGYSAQQAYINLVRQGYSSEDVREALNCANKAGNSSSSDRKSILISVIFILIASTLIFVTIITSFFSLTNPTCNTDLECDDNNVDTLDFCVNTYKGSTKCLNAQKTQIADVEKEFAINPKDSISFKLNDEDHLIEVEDIVDDSVKLNIYSEPKRVTLAVGQSKKIDFGSNNINDIYIRFLRLSEGKPIFGIKSLEKSSKLTIEVTGLKNTYQKGEPFSGEYKIKYSGKPFEGIILFTRSKVGFDKNLSELISGRISSDRINEFMKMIFNIGAFRLNEQGHYTAADYFFEDGIYEYSISVYSCDAITSTLDKECFTATEDELTGVSPLKTVTKKIKVQGGKNPSECIKTEDCTTTCAGCEDGRQICDMFSERCVDCLTDNQCKTGYKCKNHTCVSWECDSNIDCNDNDVSTKDMCNNFKCSHSRITQCIDNDLYCPDGCDSDTDNDCSDKCGDRTIDCGLAILSAESRADGNLPNFDCFINNARKCCPAKIIVETKLNLFGMIAHTITYREIKGLTDERCLFYQRTDDIYYNYSKDVKQQMLDRGMTEEQIVQQLAEQNQEAQDFVGKDSTCKYPIEVLVNKLEEEKQGKFSGSTEDYEEYQCTGSLYEQSYS